MGVLADLGPLFDKADPQQSQLPGSDVLVKLTQGLEWWALAFALLGLLIGAGVWAIGSHSQNFQQSVTGKRAVMVSALAALLVGAAPALIHWFFNFGAQMHLPS
jgi:hypothetical protein